MDFLEFFEALAKVPTAPYKEHWIRARLLELLAGIPGLEVKQDRWGNVAARLRIGSSPAAPIAFVAHLDHPGFLVDGPAGPDGSIPVTFEGGVGDEFFPNGGTVRLFRDAHDKGVPAMIVEMSGRSADEARNRTGRVLPAGDATGAVLGMWNLDALRLEGGFCYSRAADDLGGCSAILAMLSQLAAGSEPVDVIGLFTRAEESGFRGTLLLCMDPDRAETLPEGTLVVSVETSSARANTPVGKGAVLRVGDLSTVFDPELTRLMELSAREAATKSGRRPLVRALMDGGSCEATAFNQFGYRAGGVCLPLGNYHNMDRSRGNARISEEYISLADAEDLVVAMAALATAQAAGGSGNDDLKARLTAMGEDARERLRER